MMKKMLVGAAIGALITSAALAQAPSPPSGTSTTPPAAQSTPSPGGAAGDKASFIASQKPDQWLASKFRGTDVVGADNQKIGSVSDILFDKTGKIEAYVISVGGFLGMGAKEVALAPASFDVMPGDNGGTAKLKVSMSQDELKNAQNFARYEPPRPAATTGAGGGGTRPMGGTSPGGGTAR